MPGRLSSAALNVVPPVIFMNTQDRFGADRFAIRNDHFAHYLVGQGVAGKCEWLDMYC